MSAFARQMLQRSGLTQAAFGLPTPETREPPLLFDVDADPGESFNIAADHPDVIVKIAEAIALRARPS